MQRQKILIIQLRQLGDILLTTPVIRACKKAWPQSTVSFLSHRMGRLVLDGNPFLDEHFIYDETTGYVHELKLALELRRRRFDIVLDFMNNPRSAFYTYITQAPQRVGYPSARWWAYNLRPPKPDDDRYIVRQKFGLLQALGLDPTDETLTLTWDETHTGPLFKIQKSYPDFLQAPRLIALSPTHRREMRRWPLERFARLAEWLVEAKQATIIWIWGPGEEGVIDEVQKLCRVPTIKIPATGLREMAAILGNTDLFLGGSNGPSHVAVAVQVPSLQLHGPTKATSWSPNTELHRTIQQNTMQEISVEQVQQAFLQMEPIVSAAAQHRLTTGVRLRS